MTSSIFSIKGVTVRFLNNTLFTNLSFAVNKGENWALIGESGSGKSALLQTIAGNFNVTNGSIIHDFFEEYLTAHPDKKEHLTHHKLIALVEPKHHFRNLSNTTDFYYQQRYNSSDSEDAQTVEAYLAGILTLQLQNGYWNFDKVMQT
ncbi:MAG: ylmA, partial [Mucilaginibacter sp.]|nr:ylmA [Mucilaginibacter sp.]